MKSKETQEQTLDKTQLSERSLSVVKETKDTKLNSNGSNEELVKRTPVENTPFVIITIENESFGTFGKYRITETFEEEETVRKQLTEITWNRLVQIMTLVNQLMNETKN